MNIQRRSKKFSGKRNDTEIIKKYTGTGFVKRKNGSIYPKKPTNISVNNHTRNFFGILRDMKCKNNFLFHNYDELLIGIANSIVKSKSIPISNKPSVPIEGEIIKKLETEIERSEHIIRVRESSRNEASIKRRYYRRSSSP